MNSVVVIGYFVYEGLMKVLESIEALRRLIAGMEEGTGECMPDWHSLGC